MPTNETRPKHGADWPFRGICLGAPKQEQLDRFKRLIADVLPAYGCNALVLLMWRCSCGATGC
ncbi:MAG: hypothetical protein JXR37_20905 [Kiritimatiellae bacterium]|nr:hypothetical protein [Kiritimatiellia bacterium]